MAGHRSNRRRGHRIVAHTADLILEAWGPDFASCCEEAIDALVSSFLQARRAHVLGHASVHLPSGADDALLLGVLEEVIFVLDTDVRVPIGAEVEVAGDGGLDVTLALTDRGSVRVTGASPKAISRSELAVERGLDGVRCRFLVDV